jgi:hypothetical protein
MKFKRDFAAVCEPTQREMTHRASLKIYRESFNLAESLILAFTN